MFNSFALRNFSMSSNEILRLFIVFYRVAFLKNFKIYIGKRLWQSPFLVKFHQQLSLKRTLSYLLSSRFLNLRTFFFYILKWYFTKSFIYWTGYTYLFTCFCYVISQIIFAATNNTIQYGYVILYCTLTALLLRGLP